MSFPDEPPIHGLASPNSLLDINAANRTDPSTQMMIREQPSIGGVDEECRMARSD